MASIFLRVPHYVASYLKNRDNTKTPCRVIRLDKNDPVMWHIEWGLTANLRNKINISCFTEKQWAAMQQGKMLCFRNGLAFDRARDSRAPLTMAEIYHLCGMDDQIKYDESGRPLPDSEYNDTYIEIKLPSVIIRDGKEVQVHSNYYIQDCQQIRKELTDQFRMAFVSFMVKDRKYVNAMGIRRTKTNSIGRFMAKYDIRDGDREHEQLKKMFMRSSASKLYNIVNDDDHGVWGKEHVAVEEKHVRSYRTKPVYCETTGEHFASIADFMRQYGLKSKSTVSHALKNGWRIRGMKLALEGSNDT